MKYKKIMTQPSQLCCGSPHTARKTVEKDSPLRTILKDPRSFFDLFHWYFDFFLQLSIYTEVCVFGKVGLLYFRHLCLQRFIAQNYLSCVSSTHATTCCLEKEKSIFQTIKTLVSDYQNSGSCSWKSHCNQLCRKLSINFLFSVYLYSTGETN